MCGVCGTNCLPPFRAPPAELAPDLDMRPGEPTRSTLRDWLRQCRSCGAVAPDLAALPSEAREVIESDAYREADQFARWCMLCPAEARGEAYLRAAWAADDGGRDAAPLRRKAAAVWGEPIGAESTLRLIDVLRRAGEFAEATRRADGLAEPDDVAVQVVAFQRGRIAARDTGRHLFSSALRPPVRRPHLAHGKRAPGGFWARLMGR